ncbi:hypothetical protein HK097_007153 [Rhizophlyctis rosea]|uniref:RNA-binding protein 5 n=1 Tax=Rhizophlyctis rosea TaxID=64517 RepID=A0AAD5SC05_9FUNG|nr:hypothetical protein HK097_007153 [Rhizophlyctis rosea]
MTAPVLAVPTAAGVMIEVEAGKGRTPAARGAGRSVLIVTGRGGSTIGVEAGVGLEVQKAGTSGGMINIETLLAHARGRLRNLLQPIPEEIIAHRPKLVLPLNQINILLCLVFLQMWTRLSIEHSRQWMEANAPDITMDGLQLRVDYSTSTPQDEDDWLCKKCGVVNFKRRDLCFQCKEPRRIVELQSEGIEQTYVNDGSRDIGDVASHILLVRELDVLTNEKTIYDTVSAIVPLRSARVVKDRMTNMSWGFGFLEFYDVNAANYLLQLIFNPLNPQPLVIADKTVSVSFAHMNSFLATYVYNPWITASYQDAAGNTAYSMYWDEQAYCGMYPPAESAPGVTYAQTEVVSPGVSVEPAHTKSATVVATITATPTVAKLPEKSLDDELAAFYSDVAEDIAAPTDVEPITPESASMSAPVETAVIPTTQSVTRNTEPVNDKPTAVTTKVEVMKGENSSGHNSADNDDVEVSSGGEKDKKKKGTTTIAGKKMAKQIARWQVKKEELKAARESLDAKEEAGEEEAPVQEDLSDEALLAKLPPDTDINEKHSDTNLTACLLCQRQFKQAKDLQKHFVKSDLHKTNLAEYKQRQIVELREKLVAQQQQATQQYKDRAAERRKMFGQPERIKVGRPGWGGKKGGRGNGFNGDAGGYQPPAFQQSIDQSLGADNIGNRMLQKMGWKEGQGLGAQGTGIVAPVQAESYTRGAGLGSAPSGSGYGSGDGSYRERLQNLTRARWEEDHGV